VIAAQLRGPVSLVVGPEGFGKSRYVAELLEGIHAPVVHFYPRTDQSRLFDLVYELVKGLASIAPGMQTSFASAVEYARGAPEPDEELALWALRHLRGVNVAFVMHELERVADTAFLSLVRRLVEGTDNATWIFVGRSEPALPWGDWRAFGLASPACTQADLSLSFEEAVALAARDGIAAGEAGRLFEMTRGWPLAFRLALRMPDAAGRLAFFECAPQERYAMLVSEAVHRLDEPTREMLVDFSVLAEFDPAFSAAAGYGERWPQIADLAAEALVVVQLPGGVVKFRDAFRAEFARLLAERGEGAVRRAQIDAARAFEESGRVLTALRMYSAWEFSDDVLRLCCSHGFDFLELGHAELLHEVLQGVAHERLVASAAALAILAMEESRAGRQDIAEAWFLQAMESAEQPALRASITHRYVLERVRAGRVEGVHLLEPFAGDTALPADLRASVDSTLSTAYVLSGRFDEARVAISRAMQHAEQFGDDMIIAKVLHHAAWVALFTGDVGRAHILGHRAVTIAEACGLYDCAARACTVLYNIAYDIEDDPVQSADILERVLDYGMKAGSAPMRLFALLGKFDLATERGDAQALQKIERALTDYELHFSDAMTSAALVSGQALFLAGRGRYNEAYDLLMPTVERQVTRDRRALRFSEMALYAAAGGKRAAAVDAIAKAEPLLSEIVHDRRIVRIEGNLFLAYRLLGEDERAREIARTLGGRRGSLAARGRAFVDAITAVSTRWDGVANRAVLTTRLDAMQSRDLGGFAAVLASLPVRPASRRLPASKSSAPPLQQFEALLARRDDAVAGALDTCASNLRGTILSDLIASGMIDRIALWLKNREDGLIVEWAQKQIEARHNAAAAAHLFGDTIAAAVHVLDRSGMLDAETETAMINLREAVDANVSACQVRLTADLVDPVDPIDAKIDDLLNRLFLRDEITFEHSRCVGAWCARLARRMHLSREDAQLVMRCGLIHDVGKVLTPPEILKAPRRLNGEEWIIMRRHTLDGVRLIEPVAELHAFIPAVRWHHERYDGRGYPDEIGVQDIPFAARIVAVADAFNAMIARRPYRPPLSPPVAIENLKSGSGSQFDPAVVAHMIDVVLRPDR
jgi:HD-GYP domain-containing protein (c-di-GMP phosphodiesterase class II)/ATP/maltotriose-dependent transcriptional regulator MalT